MTRGHPRGWKRGPLAMCCIVMYGFRDANIKAGIYTSIANSAANGLLYYPGISGVCVCTGNKIFGRCLVQRKISNGTPEVLLTLHVVLNGILN